MPIDADGTGTMVELEVGGMHCQSCVALIEETLASEPWVKSVRVDLDAGRALVVFDGSAITVDELCAAVVGAGYPARSLSSPGS
ncbi:MAG: heavy-metal-associated domain-containing protein [Acidimicrobiales bacterium]